MSYDIIPAALSLLSSMLPSWAPQDIERYFRLVYRDSGIELYVETNSYNVAKIIAKGVVERMKQLKYEDDKRMLE
ncbi:MAG: hypothetical protein K8R90_11630 [Candidatus Cloacimonetes bacterium]|nr:hypothetical protein [Candidatus Cloacimonadota bacterium]